MIINQGFLAIARGVLILLLLGSLSLASGVGSVDNNDWLAETVKVQFDVEKDLTYESDSLQLSKEIVEDWIKTRIETATLQNKMKAHADQYDNVVQEFYKKRESLLKSRGWKVAEFEETGERITAAISAMDMADDLEESLPDHQQEIESIESNSYYSEHQKKEMIRSLKKLREQQKSQYVNPTRKDWPAVKPYRDTIEELTSWIAGNSVEPPKLQE